MHDEIWVTAPHADAILVFRGSDSGAVPPTRILQGPKTQIQSDRLDVDAVHNEVFVPARDRVLVFPREAQGDIAPTRVIRGPATQLRASSALAVDPVHNLIVVGAYAGTGDTRKTTDIKLLFFNRTDDGNVKPQAEILVPGVGPQRTSEQLFGQMQIYPEKGWIVATIPGADRSWETGFTPFIGIWSIHDRGIVAPRWKLGGSQSTLMRPRGVTLDARHKELIVADMRQNALLTYYFPELF